jgi:hypothetical protein
MPKVSKKPNKKQSEAPKLVIDSRCPRCQHKQCEKCSEIPDFKSGSIAFERAGWLLDIPRDSLQKGMLCCRCGRAACEVQWFAHSWLIDHSPTVYYADFSANNPPTVPAGKNLRGSKGARKG